MSNDTTRKTEYDLYNDRTAHRSAIKKRIVKAVIESGYTPYYIYHKVNGGSTSEQQSSALYDYGLSYPTFLRTCNPDYPNICNLDSCLAIARFLKIPLDSLFAPPGEDIYESESRIVTYPNEPFSILSDKMYYGVFHGYMHSLNSKNKAEIEHFTLEINEHGAFLDLNHNTILSNGVTVPQRLKLAGTPVQAKDENIYIVMTNGTGNFVILSFAYHEYNKKSLYFRHGALLGSGRGTKRNPYIQSFLLFKSELNDNEAKAYLPGLLLLSNRDFHVPVEKADALIDKDVEVKALFDHLSQYISKREYYVLREETLLTCDSDQLTQETILSALLKLKALATDAKQVYYPHDTPYTRFSLTMNSSHSDK